MMLGGGLTLNGNSSLTFIDLSSLINASGNTSYDFSGNALGQSTVDNILVRFVATNAINGDLQIGGGTNAAPSSIGLAAKATLELRGWSISTN